MNMDNKTNKQKVFRIIIIGIFSVILTLLASSTILKEYFLKPYENSEIIIEATTEKNSNSYGTDLRLKSMSINGEILSFDTLQKQGEWKLEGQALVTINPNSKVRLIYNAEQAEIMELDFYKNIGSGVARVYENGKNIYEIDLYSPQWDEVDLKIKLGHSAIKNNIFLFGILYCVHFWLILIMPTVAECVKNRIKIRRLLYAIGVLEILLIAGAFSYQSVNGKFLIELISILIAGYLAVYLYERFAEKKFKPSWEMIYICLILILSSGIAVLLVELVSGNVGIEISYLIGNAIVYCVVLFLVLLITRKITISVWICEVGFLIYTIANYYVSVFRGSPIVPSDFLTIGTAARVAGNYQYAITWEMYFSFCVIGIWCTIVKIIDMAIKRVKLQSILSLTFPMCVCVGFIATSEFFKPELDLWNLNNNVDNYGVAVSLISNIRRMHVAEPDGYSFEMLEQLSKQYEQNNEEKLRPNVIAVMNESFSDLSVVNPGLDNNEYMPYYNRLHDNTVKGTMLVSTLGGGTANTEYEFLTGNSMAFIPGTLPYQQFINTTTYSLVGNLKNIGYYSVALHPYDKRGYSRDKVYKNLGFDEFLDLDAFNDPELVRNRYVSDKESYKKIVEVYEDSRNKGKPLFLFNVTMQNHSDYETGFFAENVVSVTGHEGEFPDAEEYLTLIKESDEAFNYLIDYFSGVEEPTIILVFGDHQPRLSDDFYEKTNGKSLDQWSLEELQKRYEVPFFIWANYDIEEKKDVFTSANYLSSILLKTAGMSITSYQRYLYEMKDVIPAMNVNGYIDAENQWHEYTEESKCKKMLDQYWYLEYNNIFAKRKSENWFEK